MATRKADETVNEAALPDKDAEIERLKAELEAANKRAAYARPEDELKRIQEMCEQAAEEGTDPWKVLVSIRIPRRPATEDPWYWININNVSVQIPANDQVQELKLPWAEALLKMLAAEDAAKDYIDKRIQVYDPITNPKPM